MKNKLTSAKQVVVIFLILFYASAMAMSPPPAIQDFVINARNFTQTSDRTFEFDIYLLDTDAGQQFQLASVQCGITVNPAIYSGGTFSASIVAGTSSLNPAQVPVNVTYTTGTGANIIKLSAATAPGTGNGTILSTSTPGTRVVRIKLISTVAFPANTLANLAFTSNSALAPSYATRVAAYQSGINTQLTVTSGSNATVLENPLLNPTFPVAYTVTGGGTCCENSGGLPVGLSNSQAGCSYKLFRNDVQVGSPMAGTGAAITFPGNQTSGNYTVTATNANGTSPMLNSVMVLMNPSPVPVIVVSSPVCIGSTINFTGSPAAMNNYTWSGPNGFSSALQNPTIPNATALATGVYTLSVTNSFGCSASTSTSSPVTVNALPVPTITGSSSICTGTTGVNYSTEPGMTAYNWIVTGGSITSGAGTNSVAVTWGAVGTGTISVNYANANLCTAVSPTSRNINISLAPPTSRNLTNITISNGQSICYDAVQTITVAGNGTTFVVATGGITHMIAGQNVLLKPGTTVNNGGNLHAYIAANCLYCTSPNGPVFAGNQDSVSRQSTAAPVNPGNSLFRVYPNPTTGSFTFELNSTGISEPVHAEVYSMTGRMVRNVELVNQNKHTFDIGDCPSGLYIVKVVRGGEEKTARVVKL